MLVILTAENGKKMKYLDASLARRAHFTTLCFLVDGVAGSEATFFCFLFVFVMGEIILLM